DDGDSVSDSARQQADGVPVRRCRRAAAGVLRRQGWAGGGDSAGAWQSPLLRTDHSLAIERASVVSSNKYFDKSSTKSRSCVRLHFGSPQSDRFFPSAHGTNDGASTAPVERIRGSRSPTATCTIALMALNSLWRTALPLNSGANSSCFRS